MDSLTQIILGAATAEAVGGKQLGIKAAFWGAIAGTIPDLDVFMSMLTDPIHGAMLHRGVSHSLLFALLFSPAFAYVIFRLYKRKYSYNLWLKLFFISIVTHPILDMFTNYGTQFLWPFPNRITFNTVFVIDPLYTLPFMVMLLVAIFKKRDNPSRRKWNNAGLIYSSAYLVFGVIVKFFVLSGANNYFDKINTEKKEVTATPMPLTSFYWLVEAKTKDSVYLNAKSIFKGYQQEDLQVFSRDSDLLKNLEWKGKNYSEDLIFISNGYYTNRLENDTLKFYDLRFGTVRQLSDGKISDPIMGFGMLIEDGRVENIHRLSSGRSFKALNFKAYLNKIF